MTPAKAQRTEPRGRLPQEQREGADSQVGVTDSPGGNVGKLFPFP